MAYLIVLPRVVVLVTLGLLLGYVTNVEGQCIHNRRLDICSQCGCVCNSTLYCEEGPPIDYWTQVIYLESDGVKASSLKFLVSGWAHNLVIEVDEANWTDIELWVGKYDPLTKMTTFMESIEIGIIISGLPELQAISKDFFDVVQRTLTRFTVKDCPKLVTIEQRSDYPHFPLPKVSSIIIRNTALESAEFLNSEFSNKKSHHFDSLDSVRIELRGNERLRSLGLTRPLSFKGENNVAFSIENSRLLTEGFNVCFFKNRVWELRLCETDCTACDRVWLQALNDGAETDTNHTNFTALGYPWLASRPLDDSWSFQTDFENCTECNYPFNDSMYSFVDWPIDRPKPTSSGNRRTSYGLDASSLYSSDPTSRCRFEDRWDPFMVFHDCFESTKGWTSCLEGCDCSRTNVECTNGPYYDAERKRIVISQEDLPHLVHMRKHTFKNVKENVVVETFFIHDNPKLISITASTRRFDAASVKNVIVTNSPRLSRFDSFIRPTWTALQYLELSKLGAPFARRLANIMNSIFKAPKPKLEVLDLSSSSLTSFPRLDFSTLAPKLRYLLLEDNKFKYIDMESLYPFYYLPSAVDEVPAMLIERTPRYKGSYPKTKTLNLRLNSELVCDCSMSLEHLTRVQDRVYWDPTRLTRIQMDDMCRAGTSRDTCEISQDVATGCVYVNYKDNHETTDLQCIHGGAGRQDLTSLPSDINLSGVQCKLGEKKMTYCTARDIQAHNYPYFYCDKRTSTCKPVTNMDPVIPALSCDPQRTGTEDYCYLYQNLELTCPKRTTYGANCSVQVLECNSVLSKCQFAYPHKRSDYRLDLCKFHIGRYITKSYWDPTDTALAKKAWIGDCGFQCTKRKDCGFLQKTFVGMKFCCSNEGYCSTNCFEMCPPGRTGILCETDLDSVPLKCPVGWGGPQCSVKLCNKMFLCANGAMCDRAKCNCTEEYTGPECLTPRVCEDNPCSEQHSTFCSSPDGKQTTCSPVSRLFSKYKFADDLSAAVASVECDDKRCYETTPGSLCLDNKCGCPNGWVLLRKIGTKPRCVVGAMPCNVTNYGECSTIQEGVICSANRELIAKVAIRPVAYTSFCLCSQPDFFDEVTGVCIPRGYRREDSAEAQEFGELSDVMSGAVIAIICLGVVSIIVGIGSFLVLRKRRAEDIKEANLKREASKVAQLASKLSLSRRGPSNTQLPTDVDH